MSARRRSDGSTGAGSTREEASRAAALHLIAQLCLPARAVVRLPSVGDVVLRPRFLDRTSRAAWWGGGRPACEEVALDCAGQPGLLLVENRLALGLVNVLLGLAMPAFSGPLSRVERGLLAGTVATMLAQLELAPDVRLGEGEVEAPPSGSPVLALSVGLCGESGRVWLCASREFFERVWATREPVAKAVVPWLELATTRVLSSELAGAETGDKVLFDETAALSPEAEWPVRVRWQGNVVPARWRADGLLVAGGSVASAPAGDATTRPERRAAGLCSPAAAVAVGGVSVEVSAGIACSAIEGAGHAPLIVRRGEPLLLRAGDRPWAYGEVAEIDGAFAVTITRKLAESE
jgi:hypothetical protein